MNFLKTNFLCTVIKIAILITYSHERNWNSHALMFSFKTCKLLCACLYSKSRLTNYNLSWPHKYQGPEHIYIHLYDIMIKNHVTSCLIKILLIVGTVWYTGQGRPYQILPLLVQAWNTRLYFLSFCRTKNRIYIVESKDWHSVGNLILFYDWCILQP